MARETLLLLPGLLCDAALWRGQSAALGDVADCVVPDLALDDSLGAMAARVLADAPARFALAGLSMGGYLAFEIMRVAPERVSRLCLIATSAAPDSAEQARRRRGLMKLVGGHQRFLGINPRLLPELLHPDNLGDADLREAVVAMALRVGREGYLRQQRAILGRQDSRADLPGYRLPVLVLVGEADRMTPPARAEEIAAAIPGAVLGRLARSGHVPPLEQAAEVAAAMLEWLAR